jgi:hypothetical protein
MLAAPVQLRDMMPVEIFQNGGSVAGYSQIDAAAGSPPGVPCSMERFAVRIR